MALAICTRWYLTRKKVRYGVSPRILGSLPLLAVQGEFIVGDYWCMRSEQFKSEFTVTREGRLTMGHRVFLNQGVTIVASMLVEIGDDCRIGDLVGIYDTNFHEVGEGEGVKSAPVRVGRNVWIGRGALLLPGTEIGDHAVIGAGAVVSGSIPARAVVVGNPAQVLRALTCSDDYRRP
jgi:acetyltransferase-like isoleucine patch superfamily enzyme